MYVVIFSGDSHVANTNVNVMMFVLERFYHILFSSQGIYTR